MNTAKVSYGEYREGGVTMPVKDFVYTWDEENRVLTVLQMPSGLSKQEKEKLKESDSLFLTLSGKGSPDESRWQWYPYVVTEFQLASTEISSGNVESLFVMAYGIEEHNHTSNINAMPGEDLVIDRLSLDDGELSLEYSASRELVESDFAWDISI